MCVCFVTGGAGVAVRSSGDGAVAGGGAGGGNLFKFFGNDLLKQQLQAMPPVPAPQAGQNILTVEEIERRQQQVRACVIHLLTSLHNCAIVIINLLYSAL